MNTAIVAQPLCQPIELKIPALPADPELIAGAVNAIERQGLELWQLTGDEMLRGNSVAALMELFKLV